MLGLGQEIGGDPCRIVLRIGHHQDFRRTRDQIDADLAEHASLGGGNVGIARSGDLVDGADRSRAIREGRHGLGTTDPPDLVGAGNSGRQHDQRVQDSVGGRHDHDDPPDARHLGGHDVHQNRRGIGRGATRHVDAGRVDRQVARAEPRARGIDEVDVLRQQRAVKRFDTPGGKLEGRALCRRHLVRGGGAFPLGDAQACGIGLEAVELARVVDQRRVAAGAHVGHDVGHEAIDTFVGVPVAAEEACERPLEAGRGRVEPKRPRLVKRHD